MVKLRLNQTLIFTLITAFLTLQWTTAHIHLAERHQHDGNQHQHHIETHAHHLTWHHTDTIDPGPHDSNLNVIELDHEYNASSVKNNAPTYVAVTTHSLPPPSLFPATNIELPIVVNAKISHLDYSTINLRAPPRFA